jgi:hypothetical protein
VICDSYYGVSCALRKNLASRHQQWFHDAIMACLLLGTVFNTGCSGTSSESWQIGSARAADSCRRAAAAMATYQLLQAAQRCS